jgi:Mg-chelatase subunit ChlD
MSRFNWGRSTEDRQRTRLNGLGRVFVKTDRILTGRRDLTVVMSESDKNGMRAPGFSDGTNITINVDHVPDYNKPIGLVRLLAVNYHELCHLLFTPRDKTFRQKVYADGAGMAFNILEDQRIETLFVAKYRPAAKYFTEMNIQLFVKKRESWDNAFLFTYGRRYMPLEIREALEERFVGDDDMRRAAKECIDRYRVNPMTTQHDLDDAYAVSIKFQRILDALAQDGSPCEIKGDKDGEKSCTAHSTTSDGRQDRRTAEEASEQAREDTEKQDEVEAEGEDGSGFWDDVDEDEEPESASDEDEGGEEDGEGDSGRGDASDDEEDDDSWDDDDEDADGDADGGASRDGDASESDGDDANSSRSDSQEGGHEAGNEWTPATDDTDLRDLINEILTAVHESEDVQNEIKNIQNAMREAAAELDVAAMRGNGRSASSDEVAASIRSENEYRRLYAEMDPGWRYGSDHGRLNVQRAMHALSQPVYEDDDLFDEWDEGIEHEAGIEAFFALDLSGSMSGQADRASAAMWTMKKAIDAVDGTTSVVGFHADTFTLYQRGEKLENASINVFPASGGDTAPANAFTQARRVLNQSEAPNKFFFIITDGQWSSTVYGPNGTPVDVANLEEALMEIDATRVFIGIGYASNAYPTAFHHEFHVNDVSEIPEKVRLLVSDRLRRITAGRR